MMSRAILHFDADAFFASVEQASDRRLRGRPVVVGGLHRGIVASASYEARRYGIYTPMPIARARRMCPQLVIMPVRFELYEQFSRHIFGMAGEITPQVEQQSIDEGYLDLTGTRACLRREPDQIAEKFGRDVTDWLKLTISRGVARTKLHKPNGLLAVPPREDRELAFLHPLPVKWLPGIGQVGARLMQAAGITHIRQVAHMPLPWLCELVGSQARQLRDFAWNIDDRPVQADSAEALSYGHQETFAEDTADRLLIEATLRKLADHAFVRLRADGKQVRTVTVRLRYTDMDEHQGQMSLTEPTDAEQVAYPLLVRLLDRLWDRRVRLRMVQVTLSNVYSGFRQLDLFGVKERQRNLAIACQTIRQRFGPRALMRAHDLFLHNRDSIAGQHEFAH